MEWAINTQEMAKGARLAGSSFRFILVHLQFILGGFQPTFRGSFPLLRIFGFLLCPFHF